MGWLIALGVLTGLAILPLGVSMLYDQQGALVRLLIGPVRVKLYPRRNREKQPDRPQKEPQKTAASAKTKAETKKGGSLKDFRPLVEVLLEFLCKFKSKLRVKRLEMKLILAGDDPCDLAVNYGKAWAALGNLMPQLERIFVIRKRQLEVECDFTSDKTLIYARLDATITVGRLLALLAVYGIRAVREYLKIMKIRKGGAKI